MNKPTDKTDLKLSKFLSLILRHKPEEIGLVLDANGWASTDNLLKNAAAAGMSFSRDDLVRIVTNSDKQRFTLSKDGHMIRAAQGHSLAVDLDLNPKVPPDALFHGTATRFLDAILVEGLKPGSRTHVHLSADIETAEKVGARHGTPVILAVQAAIMHAAGIPFFCSDNGVWLTFHVPAEYLRMNS